MKLRFVLIFLVGVMAGVIGFLLIDNCFNESANFKDALQIGITGFVSLTALVLSHFTANNTLNVTREIADRQQKTQLATTVEKEWLQSIGNYLAIILYHAYTIAENNEQKENRKAEWNDDKEEKRNKRIWEYFSSANMLSLLLNEKNVNEKLLIK